MRARSHTELDSRQHLVPLGTCLPNQNELNIDQQQTVHVSWIKRYSFSFSQKENRVFKVLFRIILKKMYRFEEV